MVGERRKPRVVQHSFGSLGSGGPVGALSRVLQSNLTESFEFRHVRQLGAAGGINPRIVLNMAREMSEFRPDLAHIRGLGNEGFHGVLAARMARVPRILVSVHGSVADLINGHGGIRRRIVSDVLEPLTLRLATHVVTVCDAALNKAILRPVTEKVVGAVPNGVDLPAVSTSKGHDTRRAHSIGDDDLVVIIVGRLVIDKGHLDLLEAIDRVCVPGLRLHLLVVGDGPDADLITQRARALKNVTPHLLGRRDDVADLIGASDLAVVASLHENMSNALLEAMAAGVPVVATQVGGNIEVVSRGGGVLVPARNPESLAAAIQDLLANPVKRAALGREARTVIESAYTARHMTDRLREVYTLILKK